MFITFEGGEGCGKSTQAVRLSEFLKIMDVPHILIRDPGTGDIANEIRKILVCGAPEKMDDVTEFLLYIASRNQLQQSYILPALKEGKIVLCDRFSDSTRVYQCFCKGISMLDFNRCSSIIKSMEPDITFILDVNPKVGLVRSQK